MTPQYTEARKRVEAYLADDGTTFMVSAKLAETLRADLALILSAPPVEEVAAMREIVELARELINTGLVNRGVDRGLVVVEKADRSDPHYRLCTALERFPTKEPSA